MGPITKLIPAPREVTLGGSVYLAGQIRLCDLAELQAQLDAETPDPLAGLADALTTADEESRVRKLLAMLEAAKQGPEVYFSAAGRQFFRETTVGRVLLLRVGLKRYQPHITLGEVVGIVAKLVDGEFDAFIRVFHPSDPVRLLTDELLGPSDSPSSNTTWMEAIDELSRDRGWTYEYIYGLTLTEWLSARTHGKPATPGRKLKPGEDKTAVMQNWMHKIGRFLKRPGAAAGTQVGG